MSSGNENIHIYNTTRFLMCPFQIVEEKRDGSALVEDKVQPSNLSVESNTDCIENENISLVDNQDDGITVEVAVHDNSDDNQSKIPSTVSVRNDSGKFMKIPCLLLRKYLTEFNSPTIGLQSNF